MFSRKKPLDPPGHISLEEIEADLASFSSQQSSHQYPSTNTKQIIEEVTDELNSEGKLQLSSFWKLFKVFSSQFVEMEEKVEKIDEMKSEIEGEVKELKELREDAEKEIQETYEKVLKIKTPQ